MRSHWKKLSLDEVVGPQLALIPQNSAAFLLKIHTAIPPMHLSCNWRWWDEAPAVFSLESKGTACSALQHGGQHRQLLQARCSCDGTYQTASWQKDELPPPADSCLGMMQRWPLYPLQWQKINPEAFFGLGTAAALFKKFFQSCLRRQLLFKLLWDQLPVSTSCSEIRHPSSQVSSVSPATEENIRH